MDFRDMFNPDAAGITSLPVEVVTALPLKAAALPGDVLFVQDMRADNDPSLNLVPRMVVYPDLQAVSNTRVSSGYGWAAAPDGALVWRLVGFYIRSGAAAFIPKFLLENGQPANNILVVHSWEGAPALPNDAVITPDYMGKRGVAGFTNTNGDIGFGYSGGMAYVGKQGPGVVWPVCPTHLPEPKFADAAFGLGWFGGTDHTTVNPVFQLVRKGSAPPPPPTPPPTEGNYILVKVGGKVVGQIPISPIIAVDAALDVFVAGQQVGTIPVSPV